MSTPSFASTTPEAALVNQIFNLFDPQKLGVLTGDVAVKAFAGAKLPPAVLREIWDLADEDNKGWLSRRGVSIAVRLIGWAQKGEKVSTDLLARPGPLPSLEGVTVVSQQNTGLSFKSPSTMSLPPLTPQDRTKFHNLFHKASPQNGLIGAEKARELFLKSRLSNDQLLQIWNLADTQARGSLDITDFTIGMYFIQAVMSRQLSAIPSTLPPGLYQQAAGSSQSSGSHLSNNSGSFNPVTSNPSQYKTPTVHPQSTGQNVLQPTVTGMSPLQQVQPNMPAHPINFNSSPFSPPASSAHWDISPSEKAAFDQVFNGLDVHKRGYIEGDVAVPVMLKSKLQGEDLARVWDLADIDNNGRLTRDGFALAMHLIQMRLSGQELPDVLPPSLIPPSARNASTATPKPYSPVTQQHPPEPVNDLFSFDEPPSTSDIPPQITGGTVGLQPQQTGQKRTITPTALQKNQRPTTIFASPSSYNTLNDPFNPSSFTQQKDLLGDDDSDQRATSPLEDRSAEIGNAQNQLTSTKRALEAAKTERGTVEKLLADQAVQLSGLQTQLSSAKAAYDAETKLLLNLKERQTNQLAEIQKLQEELIRAESDLSAIRVEKAELEGFFLRDKEDARELHRKMLQAGQEADRLKQELEKVKKEAKQQKGRLAIAKKQLGTKEAERAKAEKELGNAVDELASIVAEREKMESEQAMVAAALPVVANPERGLSPDSVTFAAQHPLPVTPEIQGGGVGRSNNPFDKFNMDSTTAPDGPGQPPTIRSLSFENAFMFEDTKVVQLNGTAQSNGNTPKPYPVNLDQTSSPHSEEIASPVPDNELFVTPPTSSSIQSGPSSPTVPSFDGQDVQQGEDERSDQFLEATVAQYPAIEDLRAQIPAQGSTEHPRSFSIDTEAKQDQHQGHGVTDLNAKLKDLDVDEPDSDNEEIPLAEITKGKKPEANGDLSLGGDKDEPSKAIFDDIFNVTPPTTEPAKEVQQPSVESDFHDIFKPLDSVSTPPQAPSNLATVQNSTNITGISAFDAALGKIPPQNEATVSNSVAKDNLFTFDDNFDFSTSSAATARLSVVGSGVPQTSDTRGPTSVGPAVEDGLELFTPLEQTQTITTSPLSFDEVFSNTSSRPSLDTSNERSLQDNTHQETPSDALSSPKPTPSTSAEEKASPRNSVGSPESLGRSSSPAPQKTKSRQSTSEEKPGRHPKISLRLPFVGRKKKKQQQQDALSTPTPTSQHFSTSREHSSTVDDDVPSLKQLTSMGFDRAKAIGALEKNAYDVQKALNALLGAQ